MDVKEVVMTEFFNTTKVMSELRKGVVTITSDNNQSVGWTDIAVGSKKKSALVSVKLSCGSNNKCLDGQKLTIFDCDIIDSVYSLYKDGEVDVTPTMVIRAYAGDSNKKLAKNFRNKVVDIIDKLSGLTLEIDSEDQFKLMEIPMKDDNWIFKGPLLPMEKTVKKEDGKERVEYRIISTPILYQYALTIRQIGGVTGSLPSIAHKRTSKEDTMIARYLLRRISAMKNKKNKVYSNNIVYARKGGEGMFGVLGYDGKAIKSWKDKKSKLHKTVIRYLEHFKSEGYILDYVLLKKKGSIYGVEVIV